MQLQLGYSSNFEVRFLKKKMCFILMSKGAPKKQITFLDHKVCFQASGVSSFKPMLKEWSNTVEQAFLLHYLIKDSKTFLACKLSEKMLYMNIDI